MRQRFLLAACCLGAACFRSVRFRASWRTPIGLGSRRNPHPAGVWNPRRRRGGSPDSRRSGLLANRGVARAELRPGFRRRYRHGVHLYDRNTDWSRSMAPAALRTSWCSARADPRPRCGFPPSTRCKWSPDCRMRPRSGSWTHRPSLGSAPGALAISATTEHWLAGASASGRVRLRSHGEVNRLPVENATALAFFQGTHRPGGSRRGRPANGDRHRAASRSYRIFWPPPTLPFSPWPSRRPPTTGPWCSPITAAR